MIRVGIQVALLTALLFVPSRATAQTFDWKASLDQPLSPGTVAVLVEHGAEPAVQERWRQALRHEDPFVRAAAARAIYAAGARELVPALKEALGAEKDDDAAVEQVRTIVALGTPADDEAVLAAGARLTPRMRTAFWFQLGRARGEAALAYLPKARECDDAYEIRRWLVCAAIGGRTERLQSAAALAIRDADPAAWDIVWEAVRGRVAIDQKHLEASLLSRHPRVRAITYWNLAMTLYAGGKHARLLDNALEAAPEARPDAATPSDQAAHDARFAFELLQRARGRKARQDLDWVQGLDPKAPWPFPGLLGPVAGLFTKDERAVLVKKEYIWPGVDWGAPERRWRVPTVEDTPSRGTRGAALRDFPPRYVSGLAEQTGCRDTPIRGTLSYSAEGRPTRVSLDQATSLSEGCAAAARILFASRPYVFASCSEPSRLARGPQDETLTLALLSRTALEFDRVRAALRPPVPAGVAKAMDPSGPVFEKHPAWPRYPREAAARGIQGTVVVEALVGADGRVAGAHVLYGVDGLDAAAVAWARTCEFSPARENGTAVSVAVPITVAFQHDR